MIYNGEQFSFEKDTDNEDSDAIDLDSILLIYVNTVLQKPGLNYRFEGGTSFEFSRAPKPEDRVDIFFYRETEERGQRYYPGVNQTIKPGDDLQIRRNNDLREQQDAGHSEL